jgi:hypothetical protein
MRFDNAVKDVYVIKNSQGEIVRLASKKFCWDSIGSVNSALSTSYKKFSCVSQKRLIYLTMILL